MSRALIPAIFLFALAAAARGQIQFAPAASYPAGDDPAGGILLDYDLDGDRDVIVAARGDDELVFLPNTGHGSFGPAATLSLASDSNPEGLAAGDFDGDGHADLLVVLFGQDRVQLVRGNGMGAFAPGATFAVGQEPSMIVAADFNADGRLDAAVNNRVSGDMSVLINDGRGAFEAAVSYAVGEETRCIAAGDITGDALPDLAVTARDSRRVRVFRNTGAGAFVILKDLLLGQLLEPQGVALADLDRDGKLDVVTATAGKTLQHWVSVFFQENNGNPWIGPINGSTSGREPRGIVTADFDGDGHVDVATSNSESNNVSVLKNSGIGIFFAAKIFPVGDNPEVPQLLAGDLDADGDVDLVALNTDDDEVSVLLNGSGKFCQQSLGFAGPGNSVLLACGDPLASGGDGFIQLVNAAPNATAFLVVSLTQGAAPFKGGTLAPVPILLLRTFTTSAAGGFLIPGVPGGGGPLNLYLQCVSVDATQAKGFALSNAVVLQLLP